MAKKPFTPTASSLSSDTIRLAARPSAEALIKSRPGEKCVYFGDVVPAKEFTAICKTPEMDVALKNLCGDKKYVVARIKDLVNNELAVRVRMGAEGVERLIS